MDDAKPHMVYTGAIRAGVGIPPLASGKHTLLVMGFGPHKIRVKTSHTELSFHGGCFPILCSHSDEVGAPSYIVTEVVGEQATCNTFSTECVANPAFLKSFWLLKDDRGIVFS